MCVLPLGPSSSNLITPMSPVNTVLSPRLLAALVAVLLVLSFIPTSRGPAVEVMLRKAGAGKVDQAARTHLNDQREQALKGFLLLSALKVGLAVLKSSEVGFILNVRVGDLAVAAYDYVDLGWRIVLAAVAYYFIAQYLLDLASMVNIVVFPVLTIFLLLWGSRYLFSLAIDIQRLR